MIPAGDSFELDVEYAHRLLASGDEPGFRVEMERLGFYSDEVDRFIALERAVGASTDPAWQRQWREGRR